MKKKIIGFFLALVAVLAIGGVNNSEVHAAYGRGKIFTVPKKYRGTWYTYDNKHYTKYRITTHTLNGKTIYHANEKVRDKLYVQRMLAETKKQKAKAKKMSKTTSKWMAGSFEKRNKHTYLRVDPWVTFESWNYFRTATVTAKGKKTKILVYSNGYTGSNLFKSKKLAKQMKNHHFKGVKYPE